MKKAVQLGCVLLGLMTFATMTKGDDFEITINGSTYNVDYPSTSNVGDAYYGASERRRRNETTEGPYPGACSMCGPEPYICNFGKKGPVENLVKSILEDINAETARFSSELSNTLNRSANIEGEHNFEWEFQEKISEQRKRTSEARKTFNEKMEDLDDEFLDLALEVSHSRTVQVAFLHLETPEQIQDVNPDREVELLPEAALDAHLDAEIQRLKGLSENELPGFEMNIQEVAEAKRQARLLSLSSLNLMLEKTRFVPFLGAAVTLAEAVTSTGVDMDGAISDLSTAEQGLKVGETVLMAALDSGVIAAGVIGLARITRYFDELKAAGVSDEVIAGARTMVDGTLESARTAGLRNGDSVSDLASTSIALKTTGRLPDEYITKGEARALGWDPTRGNLAEVAPGKKIGGDIFQNRRGRQGLSPGQGGLPSGTIYREADLGYRGGYRGRERLVYGEDGSQWITSDHYGTFTRIE